jgi:O-acetyl-ADP-ribose deacetylase (regulator of RNase III)
LVDEIRRRRIRSIAIPPLGSGLGGLNWAEVRPRIERALQELPDVRVVVFEPKGAPAPGRIAKARKIPEMTPGRAALVGLMDRYLAGLMDPFVTLLEVHKLMYFMQEAGEPLRQRYVAAPYGPYAENLRHVLQAVEGYYVWGYGDGGDAPDKLLQLVPGAIADAKASLAAHPATRGRFEKVAGLVEGFETPFGLELLSTVHWVATRGNVRSDDEVVTCTYAWADRKRQYSRQQILLARRVLAEKGWLSSVDR